MFVHTRDIHLKSFRPSRGLIYSTGVESNGGKQGKTNDTDNLFSPRGRRNQVWRDTPITGVIISISRKGWKNCCKEFHGTEELIRYIKDEEAGKCPEWWKLKRITKNACC